jgi:hypothetical protein
VELVVVILSVASEKLLELTVTCCGLRDMLILVDDGTAVSETVPEYPVRLVTLTLELEAIPAIVVRYVGLVDTAKPELSTLSLLMKVDQQFTLQPETDWSWYSPPNHSSIWSDGSLTALK